MIDFSFTFHSGSHVFLIVAHTEKAIGYLRNPYGQITINDFDQFYRQGLMLECRFNYVMDLTFQNQDQYSGSDLLLNSTNPELEFRVNHYDHEFVVAGNKKVRDFTHYPWVTVKFDEFNDFIQDALAKGFTLNYNPNLETGQTVRYVKY